MTANAKTPENEAECRTKDSADKVVSEAFDELFAKISSRTDFHPSETFNKQVFRADYSNTKIYQFVNSYHAFCELCEQHFYCFSVADDINSFFQKHLNTSYHRQNRRLHLPPDDIPIFTWEEKFYSGRCNVCDMSGLNSYILKTNVDALKLMEFHVCMWNKEHRQTNEKLLRKLNLLKKFCELKIFQKKYLKTIRDRDVCLLCRLSFPSSGRKSVSHLSSDIHYQNFCILLRKLFGFEPADVLNGFNLEMIMRWAINCDPSPVTEFAEYDEQKLCLENSNNEENPYFEESDNFSFSPTHWRACFQNKETDFVSDGECLLCNKEFKPGHSKSLLHMKKSQKVGKDSFDAPEKYFLYQRNRKKRLYITSCIAKLSVGLLEQDTTDLQMPTNNSVGENFFKTLLMEKLELVKEVLTVGTDGKIVCQVCEESVPPSFERAHLNISLHRYNLRVWKYLEEHLENGKLMEPFLKVNFFFACLLCGSTFQSAEFCSHIKRASHIRRFEWYCSLNSRISISSAIVFHKSKDFSCKCTICNACLIQNQSFSSLKKKLPTIRSHWPCPKLNNTVALERQKDGDATQGSETLSQGTAVSSPAQESRVVSCEAKTVDFKKVEETMENFLGVFENKIMNLVLDKSRHMIKNLKASENVDMKKKLRSKTDKRPTVQKETSSSDCSDIAHSPAANEKKETEDETESTTQDDENKAAEREVDSLNNEESESKKNDEVLIIENLPLQKGRSLKRDLISKFSEFGRVLYVFFERPTKNSQGKRIAVLAFSKPGLAEAVAAGPDVFLKDTKLDLIATTKKSRAKADKLPPSLNEDLVHLLEDPRMLMDFALNLTVQAMKATESPLEMEREMLVCHAIISAILERFPQARCYPFGSRLSGLVLDNSDLDVFLDCGGMYGGFKNTSRTMERKLVKQVAKLLRKEKEFNNFVVVERARVPIVSFVHKPTLMHCDLSFKNGLSVQNTLLIKFLTSLDWRVRPLILFLKHWAKLNKLHGPPFFSSYAIAMLVIFYLEQLERPVLPTIETLLSSYVGRRKTIAGWDCSINMSYTLKSENLDPLPNLLVGFFKYYTKFNYSMYMISPLTGQPLLRAAYSDSGFTKLPLSYKRHVLNIPTPIKNTINQTIPILIVDPFDVSHILTKSFTSNGLKSFVDFCKISAKYLKKGIIAIQEQQ